MGPVDPLSKSILEVEIKMAVDRMRPILYFTVSPSITWVEQTACVACDIKVAPFA
jgi:hypothetical protein